MVFNATFNNISAILWRSVLFVEEIRVPEKTNNLTQVTDKHYHIMGGGTCWCHYVYIIYTYDILYFNKITYTW